MSAISRLVFLSLLFLSELAVAGKGASVSRSTPGYFQVDLSQWSPRLEGYSTVDLRGTPWLTLDDTGLHIDGKLECRWSSGRFDPANAINMVFEACPKESPVQATWGDGGTGTATLYLIFEGADSRVAQARFRGRKVFLKLEAIPAKFLKRGKGKLPPQTAGD